MCVVCVHVCGSSAIPSVCLMIESWMLMDLLIWNRRLYCRGFCLISVAFREVCVTACPLLMCCVCGELCVCVCVFVLCSIFL